jgi:hypothetical protein
MSASISRPATIGPSTAERPDTGPSTAQALPIWSGGNRSRIRPKTCGSMTAPRAPWSAREPISSSAVGAAAHRSDAIVKPPAPISSIRRRPNMSPSRPPVSRPTAIASV